MLAAFCVHCCIVWNHCRMTANVVRVQNAVQEVGGNTVAQVDLYVMWCYCIQRIIRTYVCLYLQFVIHNIIQYYARTMHTSMFMHCTPKWIACNSMFHDGQSSTVWDAFVFKYWWHFTYLQLLFTCLNVDCLLFACSHFPKSNFQIVPLLNHPNDSIVAEVFAFLSVFLHDGHKKVQVSIYYY